MTAYFAATALLPDGWASDVRFDVDDGGALAAVTPGGGSGGAERLAGPVVPGMPNLHSHAVNGGAKRDHLGGVRRDRLAAAGLSP